MLLLQVVSAGGASVMGAGGAGSIRVSAGAGTGSPTLTLPASAVRMATPQLLSQVPVPSSIRKIDFFSKKFEI